MKYIKYKLVDNDTGEFLGDGVMGSSGLRHPYVDGLNVLYFLPDGYMIAECPDNSVIPTVGNIEILPNEEFYAFNRDKKNQKFLQYKLDLKNKIYLISMEKRKNVSNTYYPTEIAAGFSYKINQAQAALANPDQAENLAPLLVLEASYRNISIIDLAQKVIQQFNTMAEYEAKISGYAGKLCDRIDNLTEFDINPLGELMEYVKQIDSENWLD